MGARRMTAPTPQTRRDTYTRDGHRCVMCGVGAPLEFGHRRAVGMGGSRALPPAVDGVTQCPVCNERCESDLQGRALAHGWKVRRWVRRPELVPMYYPLELAWYRLDGITRERVSSSEAMAMGFEVYGDEWVQWRVAVNHGGW